MQIVIETLATTYVVAKEAEEAATKAGDIDLLVNNAGIALNEPFLEATLDKFEKTMQVNVTQIFIVSQIIARGNSLVVFL